MDASNVRKALSRGLHGKPLCGPLRAQKDKKGKRRRETVGRSDAEVITIGDDIEGPHAGVERAENVSRKMRTRGKVGQPAGQGGKLSSSQCGSTGGTVVDGPVGLPGVTEVASTSE